MVRYDWVHICLQDGVFQVEVNLCFQHTTVADIPANYAKFQGLAWEMIPEVASSARKLHQLCMAEEVGGLTRPLAAPVLACFAFLRCFLETITAPPGDLAFASITACCNFIQALKDGKFWYRRLDRYRSQAEAVKAAAQQIRGRREQFMEAHLRAYGNENVKPKHHWTGHHGDALEADGDLADCLVIERLHLRAKQAARDLDLKRGMEAAVLARISAIHCDSARVKPEVRGRVKEAGACFIGDILKLGGQTYRAGHSVFDSDDKLLKI